METIVCTAENDGAVIDLREYCQLSGIDFDQTHSTLTTHETEQGQAYRLTADPLRGDEFGNLLEDLSPVGGHSSYGVVDDWELPDDTDPMAIELTKHHEHLGKSWARFMQERELLLAALAPYATGESPKFPLPAPLIMPVDTTIGLGPTRSFSHDGRMYEAAFADISSHTTQDSWTYYFPETLHKTRGQVRIRPVLEWNMTPDNKIVFPDMPNGNDIKTLGHSSEDVVFDSTIAGLLVANLLTPSVHKQWPEVMRLPGEAANQFMRAAQVPVLALMWQHKTVKSLMSVLDSRGSGLHIDA